MSAPTPGPWRITESDDGKCSCIESHSRKSKLNEPVAIIPHDDVTDEGESEIEANVRLILAAKPMLKALKVVRDRAGGWMAAGTSDGVTCKECVADFDAALTAVFDAIAAATGVSVADQAVGK